MKPVLLLILAVFVALCSAEEQGQSQDVLSLTQNFLDKFTSGDGGDTQLVSELAILIPPLDALGVQVGPHGWEVAKAKMAMLFQTGSLNCEVVEADVLRSVARAECLASDVVFKPTGQKTDLNLAYLVTWGADGKINKILSSDLTGSLGEITLMPSEKNLRRLLTAVVVELKQGSQSAGGSGDLAQLVSPEIEITVQNFPIPMLALLGGRTSWKGQAEILQAASSLQDAADGFGNLDLNLIELRDANSNVLFAGQEDIVTHVGISNEHFMIQHDFDENGLLLRKDIIYLGNW